jgi:hypothetical protein
MATSSRRHRCARFAFRPRLEALEPRLTPTNLILDFDGGTVRKDNGYLLPFQLVPSDETPASGQTFPGFAALPGPGNAAANRTEQIVQIVAGVREDFAPFGVNVIWDDRGVDSPFFNKSAGDGVVMVVNQSQAGLTGAPSDAASQGLTSSTDCQEVQRFVLHGITGGSFRLSFGGKTTGPINYPASDVDVKMALEGLATVGAGNVGEVKVVRDSAVDLAYEVEFSNALANKAVPLLAVDGSGLTGPGSPLPPSEVYSGARAVRPDTSFIWEPASVAKETTTTGRIREIIDTISHEAGHGFGISHATTADPLGRQIVSGFDSAGQPIFRNTVFDSKFSDTPLTHGSPETGATYSETSRLIANLGSASDTDTQTNQTLDHVGGTAPPDATATPLTLNPGHAALVKSKLDFVGDADAYQFTANSTGSYTVEERQAPGSAVSPALTVWDENGDFILAGSPNKVGTASTATFTVQSGHTYYAVAGSVAGRAAGQSPAGISGATGEYYVQINPLQVEVVIDHSGSMADNGKMDAARKAAMTFIGLLDDSTQVGVVSFDDGTAVNYPLTPIDPASTVRADAEAAVDGLQPAGGTSIGGGLSAGNGQLGSSGANRAIVLLTDGMENTAPYALDVIGSEIDAGVRVFTIGLGSDADGSLLTTIAGLRNGLYYPAPSGGDLQDIYVRLSGAVTGQQDVLRITGTIHPGEVLASSFVIDGSATDATVGVEWPGSVVGLTLLAPDGTVYTESDPGAGNTFLGGPTSAFFKLASPMPGTWGAYVTGVSVAAGGEPYTVFARVASPIIADFGTTPASFAVGDHGTIQVRLSDGAPILGATVLATLTPPAGSGRAAQSLTFFDDGLHGDGAAGDGTYGASFVAGVAGPGTYTVAVYSFGTSNGGVGFIRAPSEPVQVTGSGTAPGGSLPNLIAVGADATGGPLVKLIDPATGIEKLAFYAYDPSFTGGVRVALADFNGDGVPDIVTAAGPGGGPHVKVFDGATGAVLMSFFAYDASFTGGVFVAAGDVNGDGTPDIITGAGAGGGPHVRVFSGKDGTELMSFFAYAPAFTGGVHVAAGDVNGDGKADIVTGTGAGGGPHVKAFSGADGTELMSFFAYDAGFTGGVFVAAGDVNGDGKADIITGAGAGGGPDVRVFSGADGTELGGLFPFPAGFAGGVRVGVADVDGDGKAELVLGAGPGGGPQVRVLDLGSAADVANLYGFDPTFLGGVTVA